MGEDLQALYRDIKGRAAKLGREPSGIKIMPAALVLVADSVGEDEYLETRHKAGALMRAIALAEGAD